MPMKSLEIERGEIDFKAFVKRRALESDCVRLIKEPTLLLEGGKPVALYTFLEQDTTEVVAALRRIKYQENERSAGLKTTSRIFGYMPRVTMRKDFCSVTSMAREHPREHALVCGFAEEISKTYATFFPETYERHMVLTEEKVLPGYRIAGSPFTSGIINRNNPLKYHFDSGNFKGVASAMIGFRRGVNGGFLAMPEFGLAFQIAHNSLTIFDGQNILHGVTPIKSVSEDAFRFTAVYYSLQQMWNCKPLEEEIARIRKVKMERELKRLGRPS